MAEKCIIPSDIFWYELKQDPNVTITNFLYQLTEEQYNKLYNNQIVGIGYQTQIDSANYWILFPTLSSSRLDPSFGFMMIYKYFHSDDAGQFYIGRWWNYQDGFYINCVLKEIN